MTSIPEMNMWREERAPLEPKVIKLPDFPEPLTLREQAAIAAMQGIIFSNRYNGSTDMVATTAVKYADALIKELNKD